MIDENAWKEAGKQYGPLTKDIVGSPVYGDDSGRVWPNPVVDQPDDCRDAFDRYFNDLGEEQARKSLKVLGMRGLLWCVFANGWRAGRS